MFVAGTSGTLVALRIVAYFSEPHTTMSAIGVITVSALGLLLSSGIVWASIDTAEALQELAVSHSDPQKGRMTNSCRRLLSKESC